MKDLIPLHGQIVFSQAVEEETFHQRDLVQLFPYGLSVTADVNRPFLLLKDESQELTLSVGVTPIDAGVLLSQSNKMLLESSPHKFLLILLQSLHMEIKQAVFVEIKGAHQYVRLFVSGHPQMSSIKLRADEAMSLCLYLNIPLYSTRAFIGRSRHLVTEIESGAKKIKKFQIGDKGPGYLN
jgi:hypothetical protein